MKHGGNCYPPKRKPGRLSFFLRLNTKTGWTIFSVAHCLQKSTGCLAGEHCASLVFLSSKLLTRGEKKELTNISARPCQGTSEKAETGNTRFGMGSAKCLDLRKFKAHTFHLVGDRVTPWWPRPWSLGPKEPSF